MKKTTYSASRQAVLYTMYRNLYLPPANKYATRATKINCTRNTSPIMYHIQPQNNTARLNVKITLKTTLKLRFKHDSQR